VRSTLLLSFPLLAAAFLAGGCDYSTAPEQGQPHGIQIVSGDGQAGTVAQRLAAPLVVRVLDRHGHPVPGVPVAWRVMAGGGSVSPETGATGADGVARTLWTLGTRMDGGQVAEAAAGPTLQAEFAATAQAGSGVALVKLSGDGQAAEVGSPLGSLLRVRLQLADGRPVVGAPVSWTAAGEGTLSPPVSTTDANGEAAAAWTLGRPFGVVAGTARVEGIEPAVFTAQAIQILRRVWQGNCCIVGGVNSVVDVGSTIVIMDRYDRGIAGVQVGWQVTGGSVSPAVSVTDSSGVASARWTFGGPGMTRAYARIEGYYGTIEIPGFAIGSLSASGGGQVGTPGSVVVVSVHTREANHSWFPVVGAQVRWEVVSGGGSVASPVSYTVGNGVLVNNWYPPFYPKFCAIASMAWTLGPAGPQALRASIGSLQVTLTATSVAPAGAAGLAQLPGSVPDVTRDRLLSLDPDCTRPF
jgi:hypothetical protein